MTTDSLILDSTAAVAVKSEPSFLFMSAHRSIRAGGILARVTTPAAGGAAIDSALQSEIATAFAKARMAGQKKPVLIGAIPFDVNQPSCLYVPKHHEFFDRADSPAQAAQSEHNPVKTAASLPDEGGFKAAVRQAIANFQHSEIKKAVLSRIFELRLENPVAVEAIMANLLRQNPSGYHFRIPLSNSAELIGASPELLIRKVGDQIHSNPLAGSARRQSDPFEDQRVSNELLASNKDHYEHHLVIDEIRRTLSPYCRALDIPDSPSLMHTAAMWHLSTAIRGELADLATNALQLACALHPTPAVCGYPTRLSRKLIDLVEPFERGLFSGMVGWCDDEGNGEWVVTIRCATVEADTVRLFAGAGIVEASSPEAEWRETEAKLGTMLNAFGIKLEARAS